MDFEQLYQEYRQQFRTLENSLPNPDCIYPETDKRWHRYPEWNWDVFYDTPLMNNLRIISLYGYEVAVPSAAWSALRKGKVSIKGINKRLAPDFVQDIFRLMGDDVRKIELQKRATYVWFDMKYIRREAIKHGVIVLEQ